MHAIDFDDTLNFVKGNLPNYALLDYLNNLEEPFVILTARRNTESNLKYIQKFCEDNNIYPEDIYFTDGKLKGDKLKELNIDIFIDNDSDQLASCMQNDEISCLHPDDILNIKTARKKKAFILNDIIKFSNQNNNLLVVIHPESLLETDENLFLKYLSTLKEELIKFDKVLLFQFLSDEYLETSNSKNLFQDFKSLGDLENVKIIRDYDLLKSYIEKFSEHLIENENLNIYLTGGYQELCFRGACYNFMEMMKDEINEFNHKVILYKPLIFNKKQIGNLSYPAHKTLDDDFSLQDKDAWFENFEISETKEAAFPFTERKYSDFKIRKFSFDVDPEELVWHRDREDRYVEVLDGKGWSIQYDNKIPMNLASGDCFFIKKNSWHRIIKGSSDLIIKISEKPYHYRFENELGNEILVGVEETYDENKGLSFNAVKITMEGPTSISENIVTYQEAEELRSVLTDFLEDSGIMKSDIEKINDAKDYNKPRGNHNSRWSTKYKKSINCSNPKGFSQKQYCKRKNSGGKYKS